VQEFVPVATFLMRFGVRMNDLSIMKVKFFFLVMIGKVSLLLFLVELIIEFGMVYGIEHVVPFVSDTCL
jgi:hypothetical protein